MDSFSKIIGWHPGFHIASPSEKQLVLVGETASFLLQGRQFVDLFLQVDGTRAILDLITRIDGFANQAVLLNTIEELLEKGLMIEKTGHEDRTLYFLPDFDSKPVTQQCRAGLLELRILSEAYNLDGWIQWAERLNPETPMGVVIADDYLDPRLNDINRVYLREKRPWLLIKPTGTRPLIGPFFTPQNQATPCWQCLSYRLLQNQPVRRWLQHNPQNGIIRIPVGFEKETLRQVLSAALKPARELIDLRISQRLRAVHLDTKSFSDHPVCHIPQCPDCGDPGLSANKAQRPITLNTCPKIHIGDGGARCVSPLKTVERLLSSISPITGIIGDLSIMPDQKENGIPVYRSFFLKTPGIRHLAENNDFMQISLGKGISEAQSKASALCESIERYAVQYRGDEWHVAAPAATMDCQPIHPHELAAFSERQYRHFDDPLHPDSKLGCAVSYYRPDIALRWTPAWSLAEEKSYYVPLSYCYANTPFDDDRFCRCNSNGCAAGNTLEEALLQGFLELVERDATAVWWYNRVIRPRVPLDMLSEENFRLLELTLGEDWDYWVLDITHDFHIPVMAAVARHKQDNTFRLGFGCHIHPILACQRSLTELCQLIAIKNHRWVAFDFNRIKDEPFLRPNEASPPKRTSDYKTAEHADIKNDLLFCVQTAARLGLKTLAVDYTRPDLPIHTVRVIVPGLCHIWPQFGNIRLYNVPTDLGWHKSALDEDQLNPMPLFI